MWLVSLSSNCFLIYSCSYAQDDDDDDDDNDNDDDGIDVSNNCSLDVRSCVSVLYGISSCSQSNKAICSGRRSEGQTSQACHTACRWQRWNLNSDL